MYWFLICILLLTNLISVQAQTASPQLIKVAGTDSPGYAGDGQSASQAQFHYPHGLAVDQEGNVYIADQHNQRIRKINVQTGTISTVAGDGNHGYSGNGGPATQASLGQPLGAFIDTNGHLYIADRDNNRIRKVDKNTGNISTIVGTGSDGYSGDGGPATQATLWHPRDVFVTPSGDLYIADTQNNCIRKVDAKTNIISTVAGIGEYGYLGDEGPATQIALAYPSAVSVTDTGNLYILDFGNHRIRRVDLQTGMMETFGPTQNNRTPLQHPNDFIVQSDESIYVSDSGHNRILQLKNNTWSTVVGNLNYPSGIAIDTNHTLYIANRFSHSIHKFTHVDQITSQPLSEPFTSAPTRAPILKTPPIAISDTVEVKPNSRINVYVLRNDYDNENDPLTVTATTQGTHSERVIINDNGTIHYRPLPNYEGEDQFSYTISDGKGGTATAHVFVTVIDRPPIVGRRLTLQSFFLDEQFQIHLGGTQPVIVDPQHEPITYSTTSQDSTIAIPFIEDYQLIVLPQKIGRTTIQVTGTDSIGQSASTTFDVIIKDPAPQIGEFTPSLLFRTFEKGFRNLDFIALTGPVTIDTLGGKNQGYQYLSSLPQKMPENAILALRQNYDPIYLWQVLKSVRIEMSLQEITEQQTTAQINAHMFFDAVGFPDSRSQPLIELPPVPITLKATKLTSGWVVDNVPEIIDHARHMVGGDKWPRVLWRTPDLILSPNTPPITLNLNHEPHLFLDPSGNNLTYSTRGSFITGFPGIEANVEDSLLVLKPVSWGENNLTITADNMSENKAHQHVHVHVKKEAPITTSDSAQVIQGQSVDISVIQNDRALTNETLHIISTTQGAKSKTIQIVNNNQIRYTPKPNATGTDRFTYRINDGKGNLADGFVFIFIQPKSITPDFNADGQTDFSDFILFASAFGSTDPSYDLNGDGQVSFPDFIIFGSAFGN